MKIAIKFGDNDFYYAFTGVLHILKNTLEADKRTSSISELSKEKLAIIINEISYGAYLLYQNLFEYNEEKEGKVCKRCKEYLQITADQILIGNEVDKFYAEVEGWDNGETYTLNTVTGVIDSF